MIARTGQDRGTLLRAGAAAELLLVAIAVIVAAATGDQGAGTGTLHMTAGAFPAALTGLLALLLAPALGVQNAVARRLAVPDLTTTVLTMTLTGAGAYFRRPSGACGRQTYPVCGSTCAAGRGWP